MLTQLISFWTHGLAAALFTALAFWKLRGRGDRLLAGALAATAAWAWIVALEGEPTRFAPLAEAASARIPVLNEVGIRQLINGPIPITADGEPIIGLSPELDNFYLCCGFTSGIAASGGAGWVIAGGGAAGWAVLG